MLKEKTSPFDGSNSFQVIRQVRGDGRLGDFSLLQDPISGDSLVCRLFAEQTLETAEEIFTKLSLRAANNPRNVISLLDFSAIRQRSFCTSSYSFRVYYEYPYKDLEKLWASTVSSRVFPPHEKLMRIFYHTSTGLRFFSPIGGHGFLQLSSVFEEEETFKVCDNFTKDSGLGILKSGGGRPCTIFSPEAMLTCSRSISISNFAKVDSFHLGIILLALGTHLIPRELYDFTTFSIDSAKLRRHIDLFTARYESENPLLVKVVKTLLVLDPSHRLIPSELLDRLPSEYLFFSTLAHRIEIRIPDKSSIIGNRDKKKFAFS